MSEDPRSSGRPSLFRRIFLPNAAVLLVAWGILAFSPAKLESPTVAPWEGVAGVAGLVLLLVVNVFVLRRVLTPLDRLGAMMRTADPLRPGPRIPVYGDEREVVQLTESFNAMLDRLERERRESAGMALQAQEAERRRLARELHDEVGQTLTALLLELEHAHRTAPAGVADQVAAARESARHSLEEVRRVARRLRPEALEDLGLRSALANLAERIGGGANIEVPRRIDRDLPDLSPEAELVVYRVAQEALTNAIRHADASRVELQLVHAAGGIALRVADDGVGVGDAAEGAGITGMRERALLVGANLHIGSLNGGGTEVRLGIPREAAR